ncbi:hypothetical protein BS50DRAFT_651545 [Corynespora cassiicola Philippines]|uniref:Uncharacterized protein n=1 Tax=Corynespora cassiicola Philippines TaxID=1448308 RepID=A0A2T2N7L7_CORCC|nr:hypothetical protein BS50DRAFT_651545 [Corynespora cassiicola Philippines]
MYVAPCRMSDAGCQMPNAKCQALTPLHGSTKRTVPYPHAHGGAAPLTLEPWSHRLSQRPCGGRRLTDCFLPHRNTGLQTEPPRRNVLPVGQSPWAVAVHGNRAFSARAMAAAATAPPRSVGRQDAMICAAAASQKAGQKSFTQARPRWHKQSKDANKKRSKTALAGLDETHAQVPRRRFNSTVVDMAMAEGRPPFVSAFKTGAGCFRQADQKKSSSRTESIPAQAKCPPPRSNDDTAAEGQGWRP